MDDHHCLCTPLDSSKSDDVFVQLRCGDQDHQVSTGARTTTSTTMRVQVPSSWFSPSTTTPGDLGSIKSNNDCVQLPATPNIYVRVPLLPLPMTRTSTNRVPRRTCTATRRPAKTLNNYYRQHVQLQNVNDYFPRRPVNNYFLYIALNSIRPKNARFKGITRDDRDEMPLHV